MRLRACGVVAVLSLLGCGGGRTAGDSPSKSTPGSLLNTHPVAMHVKGGVASTSRWQRAAKPTDAPGANGRLEYFGGHVLSNVTVYEVIWGKGSFAPEVTGTVSPNMATFYGAITNSALFDWLSEYDTDIFAADGTTPGTGQHIGRGSFGGKIQITPTTTPPTATKVSDNQIQAELAAQIAAGKLPAASDNALFMIHFPKGLTIDLGGYLSCQYFCAYHGTAHNSDQTQNIYYGVLPDMSTGSGCDQGCGDSASPFANLTAVASHELTEAVTDSEVGFATNFAPPLAWYGPNPQDGEIGDICNADQGTITGGDGLTYTIQKEWSNNANDCIATNSNEPPNMFLGVSAQKLDIPQLSSASLEVTPTAFNGFSDTVSLAMTALPQGLSAQFFPATVPAGGTATIMLTATQDLATAGPVNVQITGTTPSGVTRYNWVSFALNPLMLFSNFPKDQGPIEATGPSGAAVPYTTPTATEGGTAVNVSCTPASGSTFALGQSTVSCVAGPDAQQRTATNTFNVIVKDTTPPTLSAPTAAVVIEATGKAGATVALPVIAKDLVDQNPTVACTPASNAVFALGTTAVSCTAADFSGNTSQPVAFSVTVQDTTPPALTVPADVTAQATSPLGAVVTYTASAVDLVDGPRAPECTPASGSIFPMGKSTVTCYAADSHGNSGSASFSVTVKDTGAPVITVPGDMTAEAPTKDGVPVVYTATAIDADSAPLGVTCAPPSGSTFPVGTTTVTCRATGAGGVTTSSTFSVTVKQASGGCSAGGAPELTGLLALGLLLARRRSKAAAR